MKRFLVLFLSSLLTFVACEQGGEQYTGDEDNSSNNNETETYFSVSPITTFYADCDGDSREYKIESNVQWYLSSNVSWVSFSKSSGKGDATFAINVSKSIYKDSREGIVTITYYLKPGGSKSTEKLFIQQSGVEDNSGGDSNNGDETETKPSAPTNVYAQNTGSNSAPNVKITWNSVSNATSYKVYRSSSSSGSYTLLGSTTYTNYSDRSPMSGRNYYKVKAVNSAGESSFSSYTMYEYDTSSSLAPATPTINISGTSTIYLSWSCATGSSYGKPSKYEVYKQDPMEGEYDLLTSTTSTSYSDRNPHPGRNMYVVKAINDAGASLNYALSSSVPLSRPTGFTATKSGSYVMFTWSKVNNATGYQIFSSSSASGSYYILKQVTGGSTTSVSVYYPATSGTTEYFKIKAYWEGPHSADGIIFSDLSSYKYVTF